MSTTTRTDDAAAAATTILIAEDSATQAQHLKHILERHDYRTAVATDGRIALEMAEMLRPTLIISDVVMPEMDGYELSHRVKTHPELRDTPVILVTTMSDSQDVIRGVECGADNFIVKPYEEQYLLAQVRQVLANTRPRLAEETGHRVEIHFNGARHVITADTPQVLNLLLSTYDAAIQRNKDLKRTQDALQSLNAQLKDANQELESFSYSVSHDLSAPLRHIDGYAAMLAQHTEGQLPAQAVRCLDVIRGQSRRMRQLIEDLLSFSRTGRAEMRQSRVDLDALVRTAIADLEMAVQGRNIEWSVGALPAALGDPALLKQVFANLLGNAVKYSRPRDPARIEIGATVDDDRQMTVFVRDNGVGFDMKFADKLFGVFQRLHMESEFEGTGIGLANVRRIISRHGGRIRVQAAVDEGATFSFTLTRFEGR
ncbi:MAG TPA: response regulator [Burkholderiales bacterium]|nr:response regulator [Burkholderiales bacterium]